MVYDLVIIGTSPMSIIEGIYQSKEGRKVLLVDRNDYIGGAWRSIEWNGFKNVDTATHIIDPDNPDIYKFFIDNVGCDLIEHNPQPYTLVDDQEYAINFPNLKLVNIKLGEKKIKNYIEYIYVKIVDLFRKEKKFMYFSGGVGELIGNLRNGLEVNNIDVFLSTEIKMITIDSDSNIVNLESDGSKDDIRTKKVILTNAIEVEKILKDKEEYSLPIRKDAYSFTSVNLLLENSRTIDFSYIRCTKDKLVNRITDVTKFLEDEEIGEKQILCVQIFGEQPTQKEESIVIDAIIKYLKSINVIACESILKDFRWDSYKSTSFTKNDLDMESIEKKFGPFIGILQTKIFVPNIGYYLDRWNKYKYFE